MKREVRQINLAGSLRPAPAPPDGLPQSTGPASALVACSFSVQRGPLLPIHTKTQHPKTTTQRAKTERQHVRDENLAPVGVPEARQGEVALVVPRHDGLGVQALQRQSIWGVGGADGDVV